MLGCNESRIEYRNVNFENNRGFEKVYNCGENIFLEPRYHHVGIR